MKTNFTELIFKALEKEISEDEQKLLNTWVSSDASHLTRYNEIKAIWDTSEKLSYKELDRKLDVDQAYKKVFARISESKQELNLFSTWALRIAASFLLFAVIGGLYFFNDTVNNYHTVLAENDNQQVILPDNSVVWLEKNSTLKYYKNFAKKRDLQLMGKALFEVTHNPEKPFVVGTEKVDVTVLGTQFIVSTGDTDKTYVQVIEGKVKVENNLRDGQEEILTRDMIAEIDDAGALGLVNYVNSNNMFWATKKLKYIDQSMTDVLYDLEKYYMVDLEFSVSDFANCTFSGGFHNETIETVFSKLALIYSMESEKIDDDKFLLKSKPCN